MHKHKITAIVQGLPPLEQCVTNVENFGKDWRGGGENIRSFSLPLAGLMRIAEKKYICLNNSLSK